MTSPEMVTMPVEDLRQLATEMQKDSLGYDPASMRKATVSAVSLTSTPPTITVQLSGDPTDIPGVRVARSYVPAVNDQALVVKQGREYLALYAVASTTYAANFIKYSRSTTFNCANNTIEKIQFTTADITDGSTVTVNSSQDFVLQKSGIYMAVLNIPWAANATGSRWGLIAPSASTTTRYAVVESNPSNGSAVPTNITMLERFASGASISAYAYQDSGAALTLFPSSSTGPLSFSITYLGR